MVVAMSSNCKHHRRTVKCGQGSELGVPLARCCLMNKSGKASAGLKNAQGYYSSNGVEGMAIFLYDIVPPSPGA